MLELALPSECVVIALVFTFHGVLIVADVVAASDPASASFLSLGVGVHQRSHAVVVKRIWFDEIDDVESVVFAGFGVRYSKVIPLGVTSSIVIRFKNKIVLVFVNLNSSSQIPTLKS